MTFNIDLEAIRAEKARLEAENNRLSSLLAETSSQVTRLDNLLALAEQYGKPVAASAILKPPPLSDTDFFPLFQREKSEAKRGFTAGIRRAIILALHTGPSTTRRPRGRRRPCAWRWSPRSQGLPTLRPVSAGKAVHSQSSASLSISLWHSSQASLSAASAS